MKKEGRSTGGLWMPVLFSMFMALTATVTAETPLGSIAGAKFSASEVLWEVWPGDLARCREKVALRMRRASASDRLFERKEHP